MNNINYTVLVETNHLSPSITICKVKYEYKEATGIGRYMAVSSLKEHFDFRTPFITSYDMLEISDVNEILNLSVFSNTILLATCF